MQLLIIEDEKSAYKNLVHLIDSHYGDIQITGHAQSVQEAVNILSGSKPDLIFMDVQLRDGLAFSIFQHVDVECPVVYTNSSDGYREQVFRYNAIDFLLKPIDDDKLKTAITKYKKLQTHFADTSMDQHQQGGLRPSRKSRILLRKGVDYLVMKYADIVCFYTQQKLTFALCQNGDKLLVTKKLSQLEEEIDPALFFRANRQYIVNKHFIRKFKMLEKSKILLELTTPVKDEIIVSQENASNFKSWIEKD